MGDVETPADLRHARSELARRQRDQGSPGGEDSAAAAQATDGVRAAAVRPPDLEQARQGLLLALQADYPRWWVWRDTAGFHAFRRGDFREVYGGDACYALHLPTARLLRLHLSIEDAVDISGDGHL